MSNKKFRVWINEIKEEYINYNGMHYPPESVLFIDLSGLLHYFTGSYEIQMLKEENYSVMQYIGLKDKNGKEIYEGDILEFPIGLLSIVMANNENRFVIDDKYEKVVSEYGSSAFGWTFPEELSLCEITDCEIIGNRYENPELVEKIK